MLLPDFFVKPRRLEIAVACSGFQDDLSLSLFSFSLNHSRKLFNQSLAHQTGRSLKFHIFGAIHHPSDRNYLQKMSSFLTVLFKFTKVMNRSVARVRDHLNAAIAITHRRSDKADRKLIGLCLEIDKSINYQSPWHGESKRTAATFR